MIKENVSLRQFTSFKIGGNAKYFADVSSIGELEEALEFAGQKKLETIVLGGGTNIFFSKPKYEMLVVHMRMRNIEISEGLIIADCGLALPVINEFAFKNGLVGFENIATVPGTLGGALYSNAHWQNHLISEYIEWVEVLNVQNQIERLQSSQLEFGYDISAVKTKNLIAVRAAIKLEPGNVAEARARLLNNLKLRGEHQPYGSFTVGCIFQNAPQHIGPGNHGTSAGYLIDQCGLRGFSIGDAVISGKHANFIVNKGNASSADVSKLIEMCQNRVMEKFGVNLDLEIKML